MKIDIWHVTMDGSKRSVRHHACLNKTDTRVFLQELRRTDNTINVAECMRLIMDEQTAVAGGYTFELSLSY